MAHTESALCHRQKEIQEKTLETLKNASFNKVRMCIFPKHYTYNTEDPKMYAFQGNAEEGFDLTRFNQNFFENLEKRIAQLDELRIEADLILLHPYDRWGFSKMTTEQDIFYLTYVIRRLSHFKNIWWSVALKLTPENHEENWDSICMHDGEEWFLYYYGFFRPLYRNYTLPEGKKYKIELIDTWNMTIEELPEIYEGKIRIKMGARQYMAVRMHEIK